MTKISEIMSREVDVVRPDSTLQEAAGKMKALDVGPLPVCDGRRIQGMLTDRDIVLRAVAEGKDPRTMRVKEAMTADVVYCFEDQDVGEAAKLMKERQIRRLVVLDRDKNLAGILSLGDIAVDTGDEELAGRVLERVSEPSKPLHGSQRETRTDL